MPLLRLILGATLLVSGWEKITAFEWWREAVTKMGVFPIEWVGPLSGMLPGVELVVGATLLLGYWYRASAIATAVLFLSFSAVLAWLIHNEVPAACGCFGPNDNLTADVPHLLMTTGAAIVAGGMALFDGGIGVDRWMNTRD